MTVTAIVQARMSSRRLPGKMLAPIAGKPLLAWILERLSKCRMLDRVIVATSDDPNDAPLAELSEALGFACHRGPLDNVALRFVQVIDAYALPAFVRICGDSPLIDPALVDQAVRVFEAGPCDIATNVYPRSFPKGQSIEVVDSRAFKAAYQAMHDPEDREHVTAWFYKHASDTAMASFTLGRNLSELRLCVDTPQDLEAVRAITAHMTDNPHEYGLDRLLPLLQALPVQPT